MKVLLLLALLACTVFAEEEKKEEEKKKDPSGGFFGDIEWVEYDKAVGVAKDLNKPIFFLIHKTWCGACTSLKNEFLRSRHTDELVRMAKDFVMVNVEDDDEPQDDKFAPDGGYIPRILFLDTDGEPLTTNNEKKYKNNKYFYPLVPQIVDGMTRALKDFEDKKSEDSAVENTDEKKQEKKEDKKIEEKSDSSEGVVEKEEEEKKEKKVEKKEEKEAKKNGEKDKKDEKDTKEDKKDKKESKKDKKEDKKEKKAKKAKKESKDEL